MKKLTKKVELGEYIFELAINRDIAVSCFEEFPEVAEYVFSEQGKARAKNGDDILINAIKEKRLNKLLSLSDETSKMAEYAFYKMYELADNNNNNFTAKDVYGLVEDSESQNEFDNAIVGLIVLGFTQGEQKKPKVKFAIK